MNLQLRSRLAEIAILSATIGVSASTIIGQSEAVYLASIGVSGIFSILHLLGKDRNSITPIIFIITCSVWLVFALFIRRIIGSVEYTSQIYYDINKVIAIIIILFVAISAANLKDASFRRSFSVIALAHCIILIYGISSGDVAVRVFTEGSDFTRFEGLGFRSAAWAEVALGTIMAAVLGGNRGVIAIGFLVGVYAILAADMRTTLVGSSVIIATLLVGVVLQVQSKERRVLLLFGGTTLLVIVLSILHEGIAQAITSVLLLDDPYRGVGSGFSNRIDNFNAGWESFLNAIILGAGFSDPIVNYTHNGYILTLAQMGAPLGLFLFFFLFKSMFRAARNRDFLLLAVIIGLVTFYLGQPRNLNFQLCPLVGIVAVVRALSLRYSARVPAQHTA